MYDTEDLLEVCKMAEMEYLKAEIYAAVRSLGDEASQKVRISEPPQFLKKDLICWLKDEGFKVRKCWFRGGYEIEIKR